MDLVHKEDVVLLQIGQKRRQVPRLFDGGTGGNTDVHPHLVGDDAAEGGLAQARRAVEQHVVQGLRAHFGRLDENLQVSLGLLLSDILLQPLRSKRIFALILPCQRGRYQRLLLHKRLVVGEINTHALSLHHIFQGQPDDLLQGLGVDVDVVQHQLILGIAEVHV